jgi:hypothetical protein
MPDEYEKGVGLNPNDASDGYKLTENGYSNLEIFLNGVADGTIDLKPYKTASIQTPQKDVNEKAIYNLRGQRLLHPHKGINIQNGRKYLAEDR